MLFITGLDFTLSVSLFSHLQNRGEELLLSSGRKLLKSVHFPFVILVTCDRAEIISEGNVPAEILERALAISPIKAAGCRYSISGEEAERHIFLLSTGMISPLFGEDTVQGQLRESAECARLIGSSSPYLDKLINMAVAFSKKMHSDYKLRVFDRSIVDVVRNMVIDSGRILIVGSGESARMIAASLVGDHEVFITLRDDSKTFLVPPGAIAIPYEDRLKAAADSDAIISASSGLYHTFSAEDIPKLGAKLIFDLSSPPDIPDVKGVIRIRDLNVDEPEKRKVMDIVAKGVDEEIEALSRWSCKRSEIEAIKADAESVAYDALRRLSGPISSLALSSTAEKSFRMAALDSVRKAYISKMLRRD